MYLIKGGAVTHYRRRRKWHTTQRFWDIVVAVLALALLFGFILLMRSLDLPERFVTSPYWQAVIGR
jgi:hypothetical protein